MLVNPVALLLLISGCSLLPLKSMPLQIKAVIEGEIKGHRIRCEKTLDLADGRWGVMCRIGNGMDVKYRIRPLASDQAQIEFVVGKAKEGRHKIIATPSVMIKKAHNARSVTTTHNANIIVMAERMK